MGELGLPFPWYFAMMAMASSLRSWASSQRGVSGKNMIKPMTMVGRMH